MSKKIPDISYWQGDIDWKGAKADTDYIIIRSSCGTAKDQKYDRNVKGAVSEGIPYGAYHYLMATNTTRAKAEADTMINAVKSAPDVLPTIWVIDVEEPNVIWANGKSLPMNPALYSIVSTFAKRLKERMGDQIKVWFYGGESVFSYGKLDQMKWDGLWIANYSSTPKMKCNLHQYTSTARWQGKSPIDLSRLMNGTTIADLVGENKTDDDPPADEADHTEVDINKDGLIVRCVEPYAWNIRSGNGSEYPSIGIAYQGYEWEYIATAVNNWVCIRLADGQLGWISPKAVKVVDLNAK